MPRRESVHVTDSESVNPVLPSTVRVPSYRLHRASGKAVVTLSGKDCYLGEFGTPESKQQYQEIVGRWLANGRTLPDAETPQAGLSVSEVLLQYLRHCEQRYATRRNVRDILVHIRYALKPASAMYGLTPAASFGPKALQAVRQRLVDDGLARNTVNDRIQIVKAAFAWGVSMELIPPTMVAGLIAVKGLRRGESAAREPRKVKPTPGEFVEAAIPFMRPPVAAMVRLQLLTGARPGELCTMTTGDIDTAGQVWVYRPSEHKTDQHEITREIYIGPAGQDVLRPWLRPVLSEFLFRPDEDQLRWRAERHAARKTPIHYGNRPGSARRRSPRRKPGERYTTESYRRAVHRACDLADRKARRDAECPECSYCGGRGRIADVQPGKTLECRPCEGSGYAGKRLIPRWNLHQLRHNFATSVRREHDLETARHLLGHQVGDLSVTERYAERDSAKAIAVMSKIG